MSFQPISHSTEQPTLAETEAQLTALYGLVLGGARLTKALGYPSQAAFRQALARGRLPVPVFTIEGRRGKFARVRDIAVWAHSGSDTGKAAPSLGGGSPLPDVRTSQPLDLLQGAETTTA